LSSGQKPHEIYHITNLTPKLSNQFKLTMISHVKLLATLVIFVVYLSMIEVVEAKKKADYCEVCIGALTKFAGTLSDADKTNPAAIEKEFKKWCKTAKKKEERFCYYIGGRADSATYIVGEMAKPMSWGMPMEKVCEKLEKKDNQICDLRYEKEIDLKNTNLNKLKVKDLKKILNEWDEACVACTEKSDFVKRVKELMPKHAPGSVKNDEL